jgi:ubiquinone/menaquinone biosynthesis C-methylase UbiE
MIGQEQTAQVTGMDLSVAMIHIAKKSNAYQKTRFLIGSAESLPFKKETFDLVICALMMGHVKNLHQVVAQIADVLKTNGTLLISDFHPFSTLQGMKRTFKSSRDNQVYEIEHHLHLFETYVDSFRKNGLIIEELQEPVWHNAPLVFALKAKKYQGY